MNDPFCNGGFSNSFDETLADKLYKQPTEYLPLFEESATEVADEVTSPRPEGEEEVEAIQVILHSESNPSSVRHLASDQVPVHMCYPFDL